MSECTQQIDPISELAANGVKVSLLRQDCMACPHFKETLGVYNGQTSTLSTSLSITFVSTPLTLR